MLNDAGLIVQRTTLSMATALDPPAEALDPSEQASVAAIREHGCFRTQISADDEGPGYSFSTGIWTTTKQPDLLPFSMRSDIAHDVLWDLYRLAEQGQSLQIGRRTDQVLANLPAYVFPIAKRYYREYLGWSRWFYGGDDFPCLQIVWPDRGGLFPWEHGFDATFAEDQIDLSESGWRLRSGSDARGSRHRFYTASVSQATSRRSSPGFLRTPGSTLSRAHGDPRRELTLTSASSFHLRKPRV